jgi:hypothetical protein
MTSLFLLLGRRFSKRSRGKEEGPSSNRRRTRRRREKMAKRLACRKLVGVGAEGKRE